MSSVSFASAYWAPFCPHPPTNVPYVHITQTPTICKPSTYRSPTHLFLLTAHEAILIFRKTFNWAQSYPVNGGQKLMWGVNFSLAMMSTFQQIALVPPSYLAPILTSSPFRMQANQPRPGIEINTNTGHVSATKNNLPHIGVIYRRWTWSRGIGKT